MEALGLLIIRIVVGLYYAAHGAQKAFGWFGGGGPAGTGAFFEQIGIKPGKPMALLAGLGEVIGGILFLLGFLTPLAAVLIIVPMIVAIKTVHGKNGLFSDKGGIEYNLVLIAIALGITLSGPGSLSIDELYGIKFW
ncbi:DoxX family protein [Cytobacillus firmus]|uniref:DoxX family protein n=1 Tax=Cytobacillus firmus TaxID=1399 RepID=UPI0018CEC093|nr:DoxX family protein [Cytobacillus firmus]MBG9546789.1 oxidoreductase [Cytobacillus firmus]MDD9311452.1 DoxX family protein [Cytobacillus firmus]MED1943084.1 DoxX family protein [Cytobacillus firmus]